MRQHPDHAYPASPASRALSRHSEESPPSNPNAQRARSFRALPFPQSKPHVFRRASPSRRKNQHTLRFLRRLKLMLTHGDAWCTSLRLRYGKLEHATARLVLIAYPLNNFKYFLTLFSKFFPSFPHGTCSLSVSRQYLALEEVYLPIWAALPSNPTRWCKIVKHEVPGQRRGSNPLWHPVPRTDLCLDPRDHAPIDYNSPREPRRFSS